MPEKPPIGTQKKQSIWLLLAVNMVLAVAIALSFFVYGSFNERNLREENLSNITNLNRSAATIAASYLESQQIRLMDLAQYVARHCHTLREAAEYVEDATYEDGTHFELLDGNYDGYAAMRDDSGQLIGVTYSRYDYASLKSAFKSVMENPGTVLFTPEFTDNRTAMHSFALCEAFVLADEAGETETCLIMTVFKVSDIIEMINLDGGYREMAAQVMDSEGYYVLSSNSFKDVNFFDYLATYNNLTLDDKNAMRRDMAEAGGATLYYRDSAGRDCVYVCGPVAGYDWYCVSCVPLGSYHKGGSAVMFAVAVCTILLVMLLIDVIWLNAMNLRLKRAVDREQQANRAKTDFLSRMSHDMRTPMNAILGLTGLMKDKEDITEIREDLDQVNLSGKYLLNLINDTLDISRIEASRMELRPQSVNSFKLFSNIMANAAIMAEAKHITFVREFDTREEAWPFILADASRLEQIFMNLLSNAVKYTPEGGEVGFELIVMALDEKRAAIRHVVSDNGIGMSAEFLPRLFEPFSQEGRAAGSHTTGTGLGMSIVRSVVELMDGNISVQSAINQGTIVTVDLTYEICPAAKDEAAQEETPAEALAGMNVLLVEDNRINRRVATRLLEKKGVTIDEAEDGRAGVDMFDNAPAGTYDAILMDIMMPVLDGYGATRAIRALPRPDAQTIHIFAMTANAFDEDVQACLAVGMNGHIAKPIDPEKLYATLAKARKKEPSGSETPKPS